MVDEEQAYKFAFPKSATVIEVNPTDEVWVWTCGFVAALWLWPARDPKAIEHEHPDLPEKHPHKLQHATSQSGHAHDYLIDDLHAN